MEQRVGLFTPAQEEFVAEALDAYFKFKNPLIEAFDKKGFLVLVRAADDIALNKIRPDWKEDLIPIVDSAMSGDIEQTRRYVTDLANKRVDIPNIDEESELMMFDGLTRTIAGAVWYYTKTKAA